MNVKKWNEYQQTQDGVLKSFIRRSIYSILGMINPFFKKRRRILFYESAHLEDSNLTLALYFLKNRDYDLYCYNSRTLDDKEKYDGIHYITGILSIIRYCLTTKVIIQTHTQQIKFHPTKDQLVLQLWHGNPIKKSDHAISRNPKQNLGWYFTKICYTSEYFKETMRIMLGGQENQMFLNGYPRTDVFYENDTDTNENNKLEFISKYKKCIIWMPTYRNSPSINLGGRFEDTFPILNNKNISSFNNFLNDNDVLLLIKLHPLQKEIKNIKWDQTNIKRIDNNFLCRNKIQLYTLLNQVNAVITDYSSIVFEYVIKDKPIGFAIDDIEQYRVINGFNVENPKQYFCGEIINNIDDLYNFIKNIILEKDDYKAERERIRQMSNYYVDGKNCDRIAQLVDRYLA